MLKRVLISGNMKDVSGAPLNGQISFSPVEPLTDITSGLIVPATPLTIGFQEGEFEISLYTDSENGGSVYNVVQSVLTPTPVETSFVIQIPPNVEKATLADLMTTKQQLAEIERTEEEKLENERATAFLTAVKDLQDFVAEQTAALATHVDHAVKTLTEDVNQINEKAEEAFSVSDPSGRTLTPYELRTTYSANFEPATALATHNADVVNAHIGGLPYIRWGSGEPSDSLPNTVLFWLRFDGSETATAKTKDHIYARISGNWIGIA